MDLTAPARGSHSDSGAAAASTLQARPASRYQEPEVAKGSTITDRAYQRAYLQPLEEPSQKRARRD
jgi:hypothetical protein